MAISAPDGANKSETETFYFEGEDEQRWKWENFFKKHVFWNRDWREKSWKLFGTGWSGWTDITLEVI